MMISCQGARENLDRRAGIRLLSPWKENEAPDKNDTKSLLINEPYSKNGNFTNLLEKKKADEMPAFFRTLFKRVLFRCR